MVVCSRPAEDGQRLVQAFHPAERLEDLHLGHCIRKVEFPFIDEFFRHIGEQVPQGDSAGLVKHLFQIFLRVRKIRALHRLKCFAVGGIVRSRHEVVELGRV